MRRPVRPRTTASTGRLHRSRPKAAASLRCAARTRPSPLPGLAGLGRGEPTAHAVGYGLTPLRGWDNGARIGAPASWSAAAERSEAAALAGRGVWAGVWLWVDAACEKAAEGCRSPRRFATFAIVGDVWSGDVRVAGAGRLERRPSDAGRKFSAGGAAESSPRREPVGACSSNERAPDGAAEVGGVCRPCRGLLGWDAGNSQLTLWATFWRRSAALECGGRTLLWPKLWCLIRRVNQSRKNP